MSWDFIKITYPTAKADYSCAECSGAIAKGTRHAYTAGKDEGIFTDYRLCIACMDLAQAYCELVDGDGWGLGMLREQLGEEGIGPDGYAAFIDRAELARMRRNRANFAARVARTALADVAAERLRQASEEGYDVDHDDMHDDGSIGDAAAAFLIFGRAPIDLTLRWHDLDPGKHDRRRQLVIGAALALAEIERLDRAAIRAAEAGQ